MDRINGIGLDIYPWSNISIKENEFCGGGG